MRTGFTELRSTSIFVATSALEHCLKKKNNNIFFLFFLENKKKKSPYLFLFPLANKLPDPVQDHSVLKSKVKILLLLAELLSVFKFHKTDRNVPSRCGDCKQASWSRIYPYGRRNKREDTDLCVGFSCPRMEKSDCKDASLCLQSHSLKGSLRQLWRGVKAKRTKYKPHQYLCATSYKRWGFQLKC